MTEIQKEYVYSLVELVLALCFRVPFPYLHLVLVTLGAALEVLEAAICHFFPPEHCCLYHKHCPFFLPVCIDLHLIEAVEIEISPDVMVDDSHHGRDKPIPLVAAHIDLY